MEISTEQRAVLLDGLKAAVEPIGGEIDQTVLDGVITLAEAGDPKGIAALRKMTEALGDVLAEAERGRQ